MSEQQQESMKVYELAKELGLDSFALLDKLKEINIEVKSHMSSLASDQAEAARAALRAPQKAATTKTVKKRTTAKAKKADSSAEVSVTATAEVKAKKPSTSKTPKRKVIKRRAADSDGESEETTAIPSAKTSSQLIDIDEEAFELASTAQVAEQEVQEEVTLDSSKEAVQVTESEPPVVEEQPKIIKKEFPYTPKENAPGTKVIFRSPGSKKPVEKDELLDEFKARRLKIIKQAPEKSESQEDNQRPTYRTPGAHSANTEQGQSKEDMFQPITSYVKKEEDEKRRTGHTKSTAIEDVRIADFRKREMVFQPKRKKLPPGKLLQKTQITEMAAHKKKIKVDEKIVVSELAQRMGEKSAKVMAKLVQLGVMATINQTIDFDTAQLIASEFGWEIENVAFNETHLLNTIATEESDKDLSTRPPVVTIMGHVDHGKTSLLDTIRNANVVAGEAGGITQHIGAYSVTVDGKPITFLDTPGHEAFANMRSRGANLTDIVVLVVASDDSIMPQTIEAIKHTQTAGVPMIVAANKMDKPGANIEKLKKDLSANNVLVEEWGGEVPLVPISALKKTGIKELLETIALQSEVLELKANAKKSAEGVILESRMEKGRGIVTDLLVDSGTLKSGDIIVVGTTYGRARAMMNDKGQSVKEVPPGFPVEVIGLADVPSAGDTFHVVVSEADAKAIVDNRKKKILEEKSADAAPKVLSLEDLMSKIPNPDIKELNLLIKADVFGSSEAIRESIEKIESEKVKAKVIQSGVGVITENDVLMAKASSALILGFNSKPDNKARDAAKREKIDIRHYNIIYKLLDDVKEAMENLLEPIRKETLVGKAEVKQVFNVSKLGTVAGSIVLEGKISRNAFAKVMRGSDIVAEGNIVSLKRFKDDVSETIKGQECGIGVERFDDYQAGDIVSVYHVELVKQHL
ncbi:MAG: translation initiation factor IF-2 [Oligoflexia bacterium]|nr:translation initiation factor IF-2 [Oligoflexia bacterium]